jgi:hypothetical protein
MLAMPFRSKHLHALPTPSCYSPEVCTRGCSGKETAHVVTFFPAATQPCGSLIKNGLTNGQRIWGKNMLSSASCGAAETYPTCVWNRYCQSIQCILYTRVRHELLQKKTMKD